MADTPKPKLLIITQKVDVSDDLLGFMHDWLIEFSRQCQRLTVVALYQGKFDLPANVEVLSLGKESGRSRLKYLFNFYKYIWLKRRDYDKVLVHMNPEYVVLGGFIWRMLNKKIGLWYVHKRVDLKLRLAEKLSDVIFTASAESFNLKSRKLKIIGHGIKTDNFNVQHQSEAGAFRIIYAGRISRIKNQKLLVEALNILVKEKKLSGIKVNLAGGTIYPDDRIYERDIMALVKSLGLEDRLTISGRLPYGQMPGEYARADLSLNLCPIGGMDKTVLESMAAGLPVVALNKTFASLLPENLLLSRPDARELAEKILAIYNLSREQTDRLGRDLRQKVAANYELTKLAEKIVSELEK